MKAVYSFLTLNFLPKSQDFGLLVLRVVLGLGIMKLHGWPKAKLLFGWGDWSPVKLADRTKAIAATLDPLHIGGRWSLSLQVFSEFLCAALLIIGFCTRSAALALSVTLGVAFFAYHHYALTGKDSGEAAALYLLGFFVILLAGPGKFSFDGSGDAGAGGGGKGH